ncbi:hypothetical protein B0H17DRAFT_1093381 [Mycena rosella]|uniref:C2H2-type domain-containing protein n=1 Tax=Mycena rosella TaxID=1033263 RepID=A0AAD7CTY8_MYCRO|nr:hypothetical protein B0H17DRAFT_1093381 [Mycena rosella]
MSDSPEPVSVTDSPVVAAARKRKAELSAASASSAARKRHVCPVCARGFSTTGHLARHAPMHTGERNHKCPFPGCKTCCSRQDNLQQHYRIHLSPGSRRKSGQSMLRISTPVPSPPAEGSPFPPLEPPPLEDSRLYFFGAHGVVYDSPPNTPPPLVEASYQPLPQSHRALPQIDTGVGAASARSSPDRYWSAPQHVSPASEHYISAYQSPIATSSQHYAQSTATSPALSPVTSSAQPSSYCSSLSALSSYSSLASAEGYPPYEPRYTHPLHRSASHSPSAAQVPVSRTLITCHSSAHLAVHALQQQPHSSLYAPQADVNLASYAAQLADSPYHASPPYPPQQDTLYPPQPDSPYTYAPQDAPTPPYAVHDAESPSPPPSSHHSPQTPYPDGYVRAPYEPAYVAYDVRGYLVPEPAPYPGDMPMDMDTDGGARAYPEPQAPPVYVTQGYPTETKSYVEAYAGTEADGKPYVEQGYEKAYTPVLTRRDARRESYPQHTQGAPTYTYTYTPAYTHPAPQAHPAVDVQSSPVVPMSHEYPTPPAAPAPVPYLHHPQPQRPWRRAR